MAGTLARTFFPSDDAIAGLLSTFATFAVGFVMRPVGAVVIGAYGDRHGRRAALVVTIGLLATTLVSFILTSAMDAATFTSWGWRLPFLIGFVLGPVGWYLHTRVEETPEFERTVAKQDVSRWPLRRSLTEYPGPVLAAFGVSIIGCVLNYVFFIFVPSFDQQQLRIPALATFLSALIGEVIYLVLTPVTGRLADRVGRKPLFFAASAASVALAYPPFQIMVSMHSVTGLILTQAVASVILTFYTDLICAVLSEQFPTNIRYTALSVSYGFAVAIFGGFAPLTSARLIRLTGDPVAPAYYLIATGVLSFIATIFIRERAGLPLPDDIAPLSTPLQGTPA